MYKIYYLVSRETESYYIGMTKCSLSYRLNSHKHAARSGKQSKLYDCMRRYEIGSFLMVLVDEFYTYEECCEAEVNYILSARKKHHKILNLAAGGLGGYVVPEHKKEAWRAKLSKARQGQKPALGMKHTEENKELFSKVSTKYWEENRKYHWWGIEKMSCREAMNTLGISKTHYYRLLKQAKSNDFS